MITHISTTPDDLIGDSVGISHTDWTNCPVLLVEKIMRIWYANENKSLYDIVWPITSPMGIGFAAMIKGSVIEFSTSSLPLYKLDKLRELWDSRMETTPEDREAGFELQNRWLIEFAYWRAKLRVFRSDPVLWGGSSSFWLWKWNREGAVLSFREWLWIQLESLELLNSLVK